MLGTVLITGGAGYVGSTLARCLLARGWRVIVFDDLSAGSLDRLPRVNNDLLFYEGSIVDRAAINAALHRFEPEVVFHMAAVHYIPQCVRQPQLVIDTNITGTLNVVDAVANLPGRPKLIVTSSASVYGAATSAPQPETAVPQPCDIYGYSKMVGEHLTASRYDNYVIARLFNVFGDSDPVPHLIPSIVQQLNQERVTLGNPASERDFIHVRDVAKAFMALADYGRRGAIYNIGSGKSHSVVAVTQMIKQLSGSPADFAFMTADLRKVDPGVLRADIAAITRDTGWRPTISFRAGIRSVLNGGHAAPTKVLTKAA